MNSSAKEEDNENRVDVDEKKENIKVESETLELH